MPSNFAPSLVDLNDYLGPSQLCIKPIKPELTPITAPSLASTEIRLDEQEYMASHDLSSRTENSVPDLSKLKKAEITLNDCLACSGCVTSSESILVSLQSDQQLYETMAGRPNLYPILSVSAQSLASLAAYNDIPSNRSTFFSLQRFFIEVIGFKLVLDMGFAQALSLRESQIEFQTRNQRPVLASSCPGWICYAEKTQGAEVLEMISKVKSAQQIQGALIKSEQMATLLDTPRSEIYHVSVMSCYDKKLEASRDDFLSDDEMRDVDCVLTSGEVQKMLDEKGWDLRAMAESASADLQAQSSNELIPNWIDVPQPKGSSSGGYLFNILQSVILKQPSENFVRLSLSVERRRGTDYAEFVLTLQPDPTDDKNARVQVLFRGAYCYGFKNLQNLVRKIKGGVPKPTMPNRRLISRRREVASQAPEAPFDCVEVMACPSGCVNGGGQIPAPKFISNKGDHASHQVFTPKEWVAEVERRFFSGSTPVSDTDVDSYQHDPYQRSLEEQIDSWQERWSLSEGVRSKMFSTQYHAVPIETNGFAVQW